MFRLATSVFKPLLNLVNEDLIRFAQAVVNGEKDFAKNILSEARRNSESCWPHFRACALDELSYVECRPGPMAIKFHHVESADELGKEVNDQVMSKAVFSMLALQLDIPSVPYSLLGSFRASDLLPLAFAVRARPPLVHADVQFSIFVEPSMGVDSGKCVAKSFSSYLHLYRQQVLNSQESFVFLYIDSSLEPLKLPDLIECSHVSPAQNADALAWAGNVAEHLRLTLTSLGFHEDAQYQFRPPVTKSFFVLVTYDAAFHKEALQLMATQFRRVLARNPERVLVKDIPGLVTVCEEDVALHRCLPVPVPHPVVSAALDYVHELVEGHTNVVAVFGGPQLTRRNWTGLTVIIVAVVKKGFIPPSETPFPKQFRGAYVDIVQGSTTALGAWAPSGGKKYKNPLRGGRSIGFATSYTPHAQTSGTLGLVLRNSDSGEHVGITCGHVLMFKQGPAFTIQSPSQPDCAELDVDDEDVVVLGHSSSIVREIEATDHTHAMQVDVGLIHIKESIAVHGGVIRNLREPRFGAVPECFDSVMPLGEFINSPEDFFKVGRTSGLTRGMVFSNLRQSIIRVQADDHCSPSLTEAIEVVINPSGHVSFENTKDKESFTLSNHVLIAGEGDHGKPFAEPGDSGSIVFNGGCVCGQVVASLHIHTWAKFFTAVMPLEPVLSALNLVLI